MLKIIESPYRGKRKVQTTIAAKGRKTVYVHVRIYFKDTSWILREPQCVTLYYAHEQLFVLKIEAPIEKENNANYRSCNGEGNCKYTCSHLLQRHKLVLNRATTCIQKSLIELDYTEQLFVLKIEAPIEKKKNAKYHRFKGEENCE